MKLPNLFLNLHTVYAAKTVDTDHMLIPITDKTQDYRMCKVFVTLFV